VEDLWRKGNGLGDPVDGRALRKSLKFQVPKDYYSFGQVEYENDIDNSPKVRVDFSNLASLNTRLQEHVIQKGFLKRSCYEFEIEWRSALCAEPEMPGVDVECNLDTLIDNVVVGPYSELFVVDVIKDLMGKFGIERPVSRSNLLQPPPETRISTCDELRV